MTILRFAGLSVLALLLAGCAIERAAIADKAQTELIGKSKADILACAGAPDRASKDGDREKLIYVSGERPDADKTQSTRAAGGNTALAAALGKRRWCVTTFTLNKGKVTRVAYSGNSGGFLTQREQCGNTVGLCVK